MIGSGPQRWMCPHCEMHIDAELTSRSATLAWVYACMYCGWRTPLGVMAFYNLVGPVPEPSPIDQRTND